MTITTNLTGLVIGDNRPLTDITLSKSSDGSVIDLSDAALTVVVRCRPKGDETYTPVELATSKLNGGADGKVRLVWGTLLDANPAEPTPGTWEAEIVIQYAAQDRHTLYEKLTFKIRDRF